MSKSRVADTSRSERAAKIVEMTNLINQMRRAVADKEKWSISEFNQFLSDFEKLASPSSTNKVDQLFIESFNNQFNKLCHLAAADVGALAKARKNALEKSKTANNNKPIKVTDVENNVHRVLYLAAKIFDEHGKYNPKTSKARQEDKEEFVSAASRLYMVNPEIMTSAHSIVIKENAALALIGASKPNINTPLSDKEYFYFAFVEPVLFGGKTIHALSVDLHNEVMNIPKDMQQASKSSPAETDISEMFHQSLKEMWQNELHEKLQSTTTATPEDEWGSWDDTHQDVINEWNDWNDDYDEKEYANDDHPNVDDDLTSQSDSDEVQQPEKRKEIQLTTTKSGKIESVSAAEAKLFFISELNDFIKSQLNSTQSPTLFGQAPNSTVDNVANVAIKILNALNSEKQKDSKDLELTSDEVALIMKSDLQKVIKNYDRHSVLPEELKKALELKPAQVNKSKLSSK